MFLSTIVCALTVVVATTPREHLEQAMQCYDAGDFRCASVALSKARQDLGSLELSARVEVHALSAAVMLIEGRSGKAETQIEALLKLRHNYRPIGWKKTWLTVLDRVRLRVPDKTPPEITVATPIGPREGEPATFQVKAWDASGVDRVQLTVAGVAPILVAFTTRDRRTWLATLPGPQVERAGLNVWIEAWDRRGNKTMWGSARKPHAIAVTRNWALEREQPRQNPQSVVSADPMSTYETAAIGLGIGVAAFLAGGIALHLVGNDTVSRANQPGQLWATARKTADVGQDTQTGGFVSYGVAGVALVTMLVLLVIDEGEPASGVAHSVGRVRLIPVAGGAFVGLGGGF